MARRTKGRFGRGLSRRLVRVERFMVQTMMVPVVAVADRRIARALKRAS
ncbi:MAG: hypothetical protein ABR548_04315 [Actinomycetota bacterium]|nr:hypothetical protein [Actinomycetota bacterium]